MWLGTFDVGVLDLYFRAHQNSKEHASHLLPEAPSLAVCGVEMGWARGLPMQLISVHLISFSIHATAVSNWTFFFPSPESLKFIVYFIKKCR